MTLPAILRPFSRVSKVIAVALAIAACVLVTSPMKASAFTQSVSALASSDDTEIRSANRMVNQGSATTITVDGDEPAGTGRTTAALIRFSLPTLPAGAAITDTELRLNVTDSSTDTYSVFVMKEAWVEGEATWNMYETARVWDLAGGRGATDRESPAIASITPGANGVQYFDLGAAFDQQVGDWMSGEEANNGIQLINTDAPDGFDFSTHEVDTGSQRPQLIITYDERVVADTTPPKTTITSGAAEGETLTVDSAMFGFSSSETGSTFECSLDDGAFASCSSPQGYANLAEGSHTFSVRATDAAGNTDTTPASRGWTVDTAPPETIIDSGPSETIAVDSATFAFSSSEAGSTFECSLDGAAYSACASLKGYTNLPTGPHTFEVRAKDEAGNVDATPASRTFSVEVPPPPPPTDTTPPESTIDSGPSGTVSSSSATFNFSSEPNSTFECSLDGGGFASCTSPKSYTALTDGSHTFQVKATDAVGNTDGSPASWSWTSDATPPTISTVEPADGATGVGATSNVEAAFSEAMNSSTINSSTFTLAKQGSTTPVAAQVTYDPVSKRATLSPDAGLEADATYTATLKGGASGVKDVAGNPLAEDKTWSFTTAAASPPADTTLPETTIDSGPSDTITVGSATFTFSSSAAGAIFECSLDGAAYSACTSSESYTNLSNGFHTFEVRAIDEAGNVDATPASRTFSVEVLPPPPPTDTTPPESTIDSGPSGTVSSTSASFAFSSSEPGSTFECKLDGSAFETCSSPKSYTNLSVGSHTFSVRAEDSMGNVDLTPATRTWTIDTILPPPTDTSKLTWAPPVLTNPITVDVPANDTRYGNGVTKVVLASGQDARINLPSTTKVGGLWIEGGRNVVVIGGHIQPNPNHTTVSGALGMRGIYVKNNTGVVHVEGVLIDSPDDREYDAMEIDSGGTTLQLENNRWLKVAGTYSTNHGDVLQPYGTGVREVRIDKLTASSRYQGLQLYDQHNGPVTAKRVDLTARPQTSGASGGHMVWVGNDSCGQISPYSFTEVYVTPRPGRTLGNSIWPTSSTSTCPAEVVNTFASWPLFLAITGGVVLGPPPGGEFVRAGVAGIDYVSPGYQQ